MRGEAGLHQISRAELALARELLACAVSDSPHDLESVYEQAGISGDYALRADLLVVSFGISQLVMTSTLRRRFSRDRRQGEFDAIANELERSELAALIDLPAARRLLLWACRLDEDGQLPQIEHSDLTAKTYLAVAAACLVFTTPLLTTWKRHYSAVSHRLRRRYGVRPAFRTPPEHSSDGPSGDG